MGWMDYAVLAVILFIVGGAAIYIYRAKKKGRQCIGCPFKGQCSNSECTCKE